MRRLLPLIPVFLAIVSGSACQPGAAPVANQPSPAATAVVKAQAPEWQTKWEKTLAAARQDGQVMVYGTALAPRVRDALSRAFEEKYGLRLEFGAGSMAEIAAKWEREKNAGVNLADVFMGGGAITVLTPIGALGSLEPYLILPEVTDGKAWPEGKIPYLYRDKTAIPLNAAWTSYVAVNTDMVKEGQLVSYRDLLKPEWKEKTAIQDPTVPGAAAAWMTFMLTDALGPEEGKDFLRKFVATAPVFTRDARQLVEWVARGKYSIGIGAYQTLVSDFKSQGAPVTFNRFVEGGNLNPASGVVHVSVRPRNPNAAAIFINWLLTAEGQTVFAKAEGSPPVRLDVKVEGIDPIRVAPPGGKVFWTDERFYLNQGETMKFARELFSVK